MFRSFSHLLLTVTISIFTHKPLSAKELRRAFAIALLCYLNYLYCDHVPVSAGYGTHRFCVLTASSVTVLCARSRSFRFLLLLACSLLVSQLRLTHLFCVSTFGLIPAFIPVSNLFILCAFSQATACQSTLFPVTYLNRHVDRTNAACFRVLSDFETPCFQFSGFNYSVTSVIGVTFKYPVFFVCCFPCFTAIASENRLTSAAKHSVVKHSFPIFPCSFLRLFLSKLLVLGQLFFVLLVFNRRICFLVPRIFFTWQNVRCNSLLLAYLSVFSVALPTTFRACTKYFRVIISKN